MAAFFKGKNSNKPKLTQKAIKIPFFLSFSSNPNNDKKKSQKRFGEQNGVVGLGIVVALDNELLSSGQNTPNPVFSSASPRSDPIPIFSKRPIKDDIEIEVLDLEEYTRVVSHVGNNLMKKKEYFDDGGFLSSCHLCKKKLHGLDIFMYRGEKAFCSEECRYKQISIDEHKEKYALGVRKQPECGDSPCSSPMQLLARMAVA